MKRVIIGILLLAVLTMLAGCVSKETYENVQQDLSTAEEVVSDQQAQNAELSSELDKANEALETEQGRCAELAGSLEQTGAELEETQTTLASTETTLASTETTLASTEITLADTQRALTDTQAVLQETKVQLADVQEQLKTISETRFGLYYFVDTPTAGQLVVLPDESSEVLIDGRVLIKNMEDISHGFSWLLMAGSIPGVEVGRNILDGLITGAGVSRKTVAVGYDEILDKWGSTHSANYWGSVVWAYIPCTWNEGLGWVSDYPIRVLEHPQIKYRICDIYGHWVQPRFEVLEPTTQIMTLVLDPELIAQARESAVEAGVDFEAWLTEAILAKIR